MPTIVANILEPALCLSADPLAAELLARVRRANLDRTRATATRPFSRRAAVRIYREKAARGDRPTVRTDGYPALLATLDAAPDGEVIVHGVAFPDVVYLVFTDAARHKCLGVLRKTRLARGD